MIKDFSIFLNENIINANSSIEEIKNFLLEDNGYENWTEFVDNQNMGDCQGIVASIVRQFPQVIKIFGGLKLDEPCVDWDTGEEDDEITHHWVEIDGVPYDFSKGTFKYYINMDKSELYDPEIYDEWRYKDIGYYVKDSVDVIK